MRKRIVSLVNQDFVNAISGDMTSAINEISKLGTDK